MKNERRNRIRIRFPALAEIASSMVNKRGWKSPAIDGNCFRIYSPEFGQLAGDCSAKWKIPPVVLAERKPKLPNRARVRDQGSISPRFVPKAVRNQRYVTGTRLDAEDRRFASYDYRELL